MRTSFSVQKSTRGFALVLLLSTGESGMAAAAPVPAGTQLYMPVTASEPSGLTKFEKKLPKAGKHKDKKDKKDKDKDSDENKDIDTTTHLPVIPVSGAALPHPSKSDLPWEPSK